MPHLPSLDIYEGAISDMIRIYKECVTTGRITGYLCNRGNCNLERCGVILQELGKMEDQIFVRRHATFTACYNGFACHLFV